MVALKYTIKNGLSTRKHMQEISMSNWRLCQKCESPIEFAEVIVSLPPHIWKDRKRVCFECGLLIIAEHNKALGKETKKVLIIKEKPKGDGNEDI